jgi:hypothetical protein
VAGRRPGCPVETCVDRDGRTTIHWPVTAPTGRLRGA